MHTIGNNWIIDRQYELEKNSDFIFILVVLGQVECLGPAACSMYDYWMDESVQQQWRFGNNLL